MKSAMRAITTTSVMSFPAKIEIMDYRKRLKEAILIHRKLVENTTSEPEILDFQLEKRAAELHDFFYTVAPWYVREVHDSLGRPYLLCGRPGVNAALLREIKAEQQSNS